MDGILIILAVAGISFGVASWIKLEKTLEELSNCKRFHLKYKTELGIPDRDYQDNEECYKGIAGGDR